MCTHHFPTQHIQQTLLLPPSVATAKTSKTESSPNRQSMWVFCSSRMEYVGFFGDVTLHMSVMEMLDRINETLQVCTVQRAYHTGVSTPLACASIHAHCLHNLFLPHTHTPAHDQQTRQVECHIPAHYLSYLDRSPAPTSDVAPVRDQFRATQHAFAARIARRGCSVVPAR